jgi:hypothetical protein
MAVNYHSVRHLRLGRDRGNRGRATSMIDGGVPLVHDAVLEARDIKRRSAETPRSPTAEDDIRLPDSGNLESNYCKCRPPVQ